MKKSLSIIMPVHNVQSTVDREVERLLEIVADLTADFEILIVDDGSTDGTEEVLYDLCCRYPQVRSRRYTPRQGSATAIDLGLAAALGEVVMIQDQYRQLTADDIHSLWAMHLDAVTAQHHRPAREVMQRTTPFVPADPEPLAADLLQRLSNWGADVTQLPTSAFSDTTARPEPAATSHVRQSVEVVDPPAPRLKMPRFLRRIHEFASGE